MRMALILFSFLVSALVQSADLKEITLKEYKTGTPYSFKENVGKKKIVLNFWASWCTSCIEELPLLHTLQEQNKGKNVEFIAINSGENKKRVKKFLRRYDFKYKILMDPKKSVADVYNIENLPQTLILDEKGKVVFRGNRPPKTIP